MKCPKCKKPSELQTKRTMANGNKVTRDRYCPRCKSRFVTIEQFWADVNQAELVHTEHANSLEASIQDLSDKLGVYQDLFRGLKQALDKAGKK